jgi:hypothetical protein
VLRVVNVDDEGRAIVHVLQRWLKRLSFHDTIIFWPLAEAAVVEAIRRNSFGRNLQTKN